MGDGAFEYTGQDFHIVMGVLPKTLMARDHVVIDDT
jgi:hypothetical protein